MQIRVSTRHGHLAAETQEKISQKLEKLTRFHDRISSAQATIDLREGGEPKVELKVAVDGAPEFISHSRGTNLLGAVDGAVQKLEQQLRRHKEKVIDQHRDPGRRRSAEPLLDTDADDEGEDED